MANDIFDFWGMWNSFAIDNTNTGVRNEARLTDLRDRASYLAKKTGQEPTSWYEFKQHQPPERQKPKGIGSLLLGAAVGGLIGALFFPIAVITVPVGIVVGGIVGVNGWSTESTRRASTINNYEAYLDGFEQQAILQRGIAQSMQQGMGNHAERVLANREPQSKGLA
jgi:hypothetical protein